ncbi:hypothetical protein ACO2Q0_02400 [Phenylobacterium sp. VNQ135]|uniref:hypothetical protein n=1 Tax=Phenylobacterium sp. VNQ135 TaxID=3400922 RepID=UPI003BFD6FE7
MNFEYLFVEGERVARQRFAQQVANTRHVAVVGAFEGQLGWTNEALAMLLLRGPEADPARKFQVRGAQLRDHAMLTPTARPNDLQPLPTGGIYVHRWFVVRAPDVPRFVDLSAAGWQDFEQRFDARVYGLFTAAPTQAERSAGSRRLLLLTRYRDHAEWERSRDPTSEAMAIFRERQKLTLRTWAASSRLLS